MGSCGSLAPAESVSRHRECPAALHALVVSPQRSPGLLDVPESLETLREQRRATAALPA
jgi:hypothetical protein